MYSLTRVPNRGWGLLGDMDDLVNGFFAPAQGREVENTLFSPALDIVETADGYEIRADLPGVDRDDLSVSIKDNVLTIEAETRSENVEKDGDTVIKRERQVGKFQRTLRLGKAVDESKVSADYRDGVLKLSLPRSTEVDGRRIDVNVQ